MEIDRNGDWNSNAKQYEHKFEKFCTLYSYVKNNITNLMFTKLKYTILNRTFNDLLFYLDI